MILFTRQLGAGLRVLLALTVLTGVLYPLVVLGVGQGVAHDRANGSLLTRDGTVVASSSLGQAVPEADAAKWFQPRPSASDYAGDSSGGTNLGPSSLDLAKAVAEREAALKQAGATGTLPPDALTSSGSGLDPDISPAYAALQVQRVAQARGLSVSAVQQLVQEHTRGRILGFLGEPRVNTTELNLALSRLS
ncbi:K(+)-transporting ATPase subunit C [Lapillicoccus jejuensis]|uniref:Potassium-transporting ATPase KdpC subunit n=1 Tax=Lapillicoccus jejuensis TaxID=402171 RepID=A0A542E410_9MICO|nr:K(+)-transporting ATPase subunit C [Lapillicoccus jejuensis]TQJ10055.1 K+-transporting ATPase ATPase C chain [Lapillicoccus jejuensis]